MRSPRSTKGRSELLTPSSLADAARSLAQRDQMLAGIHAAFGNPPLWRRATGFPTLVHIILEQQVSLRSGRAMFDRLNRTIQPFTPQRFVQLGDQHLRGLGVTRQKATYLIQLSSSIVAGDLNLRSLSYMSDSDARLVLMSVKGIGTWSADVYLLMAMRRADVWPSGDLALAVAVKELKRLDHKPTPEHLEKLAERWRPHRAVAARMLWQYYLGRKKLTASNAVPI